jgi:AAA+ superfamily predicted ATPase
MTRRRGRVRGLTREGDIGVCISDRLMFDSFLGDTKEVMFSYFVQGIEKIFARDVKDYKLATLNTRHVHIECLEDFIRHNKIHSIAGGFDIPNRKTIPLRCSLVVNKDAELKKEQSYGFYCLFPKSDNELIFYLCESGDYHDDTVIFVAYRKAESLQDVVAGLKEYYKTAKSIGNKIFFQGHKEMVKEDVRWGDIILPDDMKNDIRLCTENFLRGRHIYQKMAIPYKRGLLFTGRPGNGKTMLCKIIARESCLPFILFTFDDESRDYDISRAFEKAEELSPAILCFEDMDAISGSRQTLSNFLNKLDGFEPLEGIMILATTNKPEDIDPALCNRPSRFDRVFRIPNPDYHQRFLMLKKYMGNLFAENIVRDAASVTDDFSMAYLKELYIYSAMIALDEGSPVPTADNLFHALERLKDQIKNSSKPLDRTEGQNVGFERSRRSFRPWLRS